MNFEPGNTYWVLTRDEFDIMLEFLHEQGLGYDLEDDFVLCDDGNYYATQDKVDSNEYSFLEDNGILNPFVYTKSTQSTSPV